MTTATKELLERLAEFDTALVANTVGAIDTTPVHEWYMGGSIQSVTPSLGPTCGVAYTCELDTSTPGGEAAMDDWWRVLEAIEADARPSVLVVHTVGSRPDHECAIGDGMAKILHTAGCIGLVTDGGVRDVAGLLAVPFAAYARGRTIHHGVLRFRAANAAVEIGGITVRAGDIVHADGGGAIVVPAGCAEALPAQAIRMLAFEREAHLLLRRTDLRAAEKRRAVPELLAGYKFVKRKDG
jgi:4-hydroxy-4-methyl-2-oxoglutarate aldolase